MSGSVLSLVYDLINLRDSRYRSMLIDAVHGFSDVVITWVNVSLRRVHVRVARQDVKRERVHVFRRTGDAETSLQSYRGFEDRRTGKPSQFWAMVRIFGTFPDGAMPDDARHGKEWLAIKKKIERASQALRRHFRMTGDPFPYISNVGYRSRIKIVLS